MDMIASFIYLAIGIAALIAGAIQGNDTLLIMSVILTCSSTILTRLS